MTDLETWQARFEAYWAQAQGGDGAHDVHHLRRVWRSARRIARKEPGADPLVILAAAYLHDLVNPPKDSPLRSQASRLSLKPCSASTAPDGALGGSQSRYGSRAPSGIAKASASSAASRMAGPGRAAIGVQPASANAASTARRDSFGMGEVESTAARAIMDPPALGIPLGNPIRQRIAR